MAKPSTPYPAQPPRALTANRGGIEARFIVREYKLATGETTFRIRGFTRTGKRIREQFQDLDTAKARANELEAQWIGQDSGQAMRLTSLSPQWLRVAEYAAHRLRVPGDLKLAVDHWIKYGAEHLGPGGGRPNLEVALGQFSAWLDSDPECDLRPKTKIGYKKFLDQYVQEAGPIELSLLNPDSIAATLRKRWPTQLTARHNVRIALSRFCAWCMQEPRRWFSSNPASGKLIRTRPAHAARESEPEIFSLHQVMRLLVAARRLREGKFLRFLVLSLFTGLRPQEACRVRPEQVRLADGELRIEPAQSKTGTPRLIHLTQVAIAWLKLCPKGPTVDWTKSRLHWDELKAKARITHWPHDGLRHTAISHFFRAEGSYGLTAEWAGNSESIIKAHYQGRVTRAESDLYWTLFPDRTERRVARAHLGTTKPSPSASAPAPRRDSRTHGFGRL